MSSTSLYCNLITGRSVELTFLLNWKWVMSTSVRLPRYSRLLGNYEATSLEKVPTSCSTFQVIVGFRRQVVDSGPPNGTVTPFLRNEVAFLKFIILSSNFTYAIVAQVHVTNFDSHNVTQHCYSDDNKNIFYKWKL